MSSPKSATQGATDYQTYPQQGFPLEMILTGVVQYTLQVCVSSCHLAEIMPLQDCLTQSGGRCW